MDPARILPFVLERFPAQEATLPAKGGREARGSAPRAVRHRSRARGARLKSPAARARSVRPATLLATALAAAALLLAVALAASSAAPAGATPLPPPSPQGDGGRPLLAAGVASAQEWTRASALGVTLDAIVGREWITADADEAGIDAIVWRLSRLQWETRLPVVLHDYYWGDTAHRRACFEEAGLCGGRSVAAWEARAGAIGGSIARWAPPGAKWIVVIETEIDNDAADQRENAAWWETEYPRLARRVASAIESRALGHAETAVSLGAWAPESYARWSALLNAPELDYAGFQTSGNHEREGEPCPVDDYATLFAERTLRAAEAMARVAPGKPLGVWDVFVSSHGAGGERDQARYFHDLSRGRDRLAALGVRWIAVRTLADDPAQSGCLGEDERHFGLLAGARAKPAFEAFVEAFAHPRALPGEAGTPQAASAGRAEADARAGDGRAWSLPAGAHARATFRAPEDGEYVVAACLAADAHAVAELRWGATRIWKGASPLDYEARSGAIQLSAGETATVALVAIGPASVRLDGLHLRLADAPSSALDACAAGSLERVAPAPAQGTREAERREDAEDAARLALR